MKIIKKLSFIFCLFVSLFVLINCNNKRNENDLTSAIYDVYYDLKSEKFSSFEIRLRFYEKSFKEPYFDYQCNSW